MAQQVQSDTRQKERDMLIFWICLGIMLWLLDRALRRGRLEMLMLRTRAKLIGLRNALQDMLISGAVKDNELYQAIDSLLLNSSQTLECRNMFTLAAFIVLEHLAPMPHEMSDYINTQLACPENARYKPIVSSYHGCIREFFRQRHWIIVPLGAKCVRLFAQRGTIDRYDIKKFPTPPSAGSYKGGSGKISGVDGTHDHDDRLVHA